MKHGRLYVAAALIVSLSLCANPSAYAQGVSVGKDGTVREGELALPYAFYNQNFGAAAGFVYGSSGWPQKQATVVATAIAGTNSALAFYGLGRDIQLHWITERLFLDVDLALSTFGTLYSFTNGKPGYAGQEAGTNDSSDENYIRGSGKDNIARVKFRYLLPVGTGKEEIISSYVLDRGILIKGAQGAYSWNPLTSGKTYLEAKPFWRQQSVLSRHNRLYSRTNGIELSIARDNTDFPKNPSDGSYLRARYTGDLGCFDSSTEYDVWDVEYAKYFPLGSSDRFRQRVLAFDVWTADTPSWDDSHRNNNGDIVYERPPAWAGATLGGIWRMRAYPTGRYHDQAAMYYALEYRMTPRWNPFENYEWVKRYLGIAWWQWVPFVEAGRVAPTWNIERLHSNMKVDAGFGVRAMAKGIVVRIDAAAGGAGNWGVQMMVGQPFNF